MEWQYQPEKGRWAQYYYGAVLEFYRHMANTTKISD
jgi:hypothetical protein